MQTVWNQEIPYVVDRVIGLCLFGDPHAEPDPMPPVIVHRHQVTAGTLAAIDSRGWSFRPGDF